MLTDLPNILTLSRIGAIPVLVALVAMGGAMMDCAACLLFIAAAITDYLDGRLARARQQYSELGRMLDPIADKLLVGASLMMLAGTDHLPFGALYPAIIILAREILISGMREFLAATRISLPVTRLAKWKTGIQMTAIGFLLAGDGTGRLLHMPWLPVGLIGSILLWIAAVLTVMTGWDYLMTALRHIGRHDGASKIAS
ncbi:CDP-diacylglycerol--glycerol-3-phosphate 3-phosphatidyltransferase [Gluconacetobacter liquefaciens]|uniref:CDP-diacylglycerol--glycerol-3-phosphate 3-phosphatidyltransferase n=1 Tax=Gluconacetobacter liquefaciens TaxID=89584 RepID=A0A370G532_GLULI|nr:CDP-diacylglycerol--glycerol-3-phosphate 3-phosphatidyltransferase [Gluconacetobacter liquefaciens]MBB2186359.1 CDP-diacylglycerol--glycerol-3-phosphate 3-phosphatidyltransferase [Gluconacetobacter liquefaciens]RDI38902.1 cardiolipin synthase [Gluconacetobacter liquefaciens]GBQ98319.1 CDP-diacylglycerol--glycerol-3-phosphate 3-phosphatidyltransferase [Gluconacetobacter liquefaciens NRIC 0522]GEB36542.1 CDP-diacylglycerol--glycerol-3-phosphate 3-phosphatidyltransferase [Gluconacetobacter liqu